MANLDLKFSALALDQQVQENIPSMVIQSPTSSYISQPHRDPAPDQPQLPPQSHDNIPSQAVESPTSDTSPPTTFHTLPAELRLQIWRATFPRSQIRRISNFRASKRYLISNLPIALHICRESRSETLLHYILYIPPTHPTHLPCNRSLSHLSPFNQHIYRPLIFSPALDTIILAQPHGPFLSNLLRLTAQQSSTISKLKRLQIAWPNLERDWGVLFWLDYARLESIIRQLKELEEVEIYVTKEYMQLLADGWPWNAPGPDFEKIEKEEMRGFVEKTRKRIEGCKIKSMKVVKYAGKLA